MGAHKGSRSREVLNIHSGLVQRIYDLETNSNFMLPEARPVRVSVFLPSNILRETPLYDQLKKMLLNTPRSVLLWGTWWPRRSS